MIAAGLVPMFEKEARERQKGGQGGAMLSANLREATGKATEKAATAVNVSPRSVESAQNVLRESVGADLALAQRRVLAACWTAPEAFRARVQRLAALVAGPEGEGTQPVHLEAAHDS